jgi:hypothetical protein
MSEFLLLPSVNEEKRRLPSLTKNEEKRRLPSLTKNEEKRRTLHIDP